ncbi:DUF1835 domain-containing protein [Desulfosediminicola flagellatus]|uniref:DUF1835 domain-containing protein n=1 Tax=Desulfosediminicola flagellatus TaxID=2569541 RepID=UPI0010AB692C|nr:DUF1835 domain-containing protein [Desulfosediminicola flagellatus]
MATVLHIVNGDGAGDSLKKTGISGDFLICRDLLYDGPRNLGWPDEATLAARAEFLEEFTGGGMDTSSILEILQSHYQQFLTAKTYDNIVLWFDGCLCDQTMLAHTLVCLDILQIDQVELICINSFPGVERFNGLGQLDPSQLASLYGTRQHVTKEQIDYAKRVNTIFVTQDLQLLKELAADVNAPLPFVPAAAARWIQEQPDPDTGLGRLESLALEAIVGGRNTPGEIFRSVADADVPPQFWGDITLWQKINSLTLRTPPLVCIDGPSTMLPQGGNPDELKKYRVYPSKT